MSSLHGSIQCWGMRIVQRSCCVCVQVGRRKYEIPSLVWMWFHCGWVENWLWSATAVGGGWWVRRPTVGEETRWWVLPQAMPGQLLLLLQRWSEPATILTPILTSPYLPVPASMCASFLFTFSTVSPLAHFFTYPNCPNYLVASSLIFHLGMMNSNPELISFKKGLSTQF